MVSRTARLFPIAFLFAFFPLASLAVDASAQAASTGQQPASTSSGSQSTSSNQAEKQTPSKDLDSKDANGAQGSGTSANSAGNGNAAGNGNGPGNGNSAKGQQTKRILWIFPNYRSVSANTQLPTLSLRRKFWLATQDSFDYSSFLLAGAVAGLGQWQNQYPEFKQGGAGYGRYYWHSFVDQAVGNYFTEAIVPAIAHEDPRYYTLGQGGFVLRVKYALSRLVVTRTDYGGKTFNFSEIAGNGAGAAVSNLYYPGRERTFAKTGTKWATQVGLDGLFNVVKEFWPDINQALFHGKY